MRSCDEIVELISASLDGQLTADEQKALNEHIAHCPACGALLDELRELHEAAAELEEVPAPADFAAGVMSAIAADPAQEKPNNVIPFAPRKASRTVWKKWAVTAAVFAVVALGAASVPSLLGNSGMTKAESADADVAFDNVAVADAVMDYSVANQSKGTAAESEAYFDQAEDGLAYEETAADTAADEEPLQPPMQEVSAGASAPDQAPEPSSPGEANYGYQNYVGVLILEGQVKFLKRHEGVASSDGTVTYLLPAGEFATLLAQLEEHKEVGYAYTAGTADSTLGKVIVQSMN